MKNNQYVGSVVRPYREGLSSHEAPNTHNVSLLSLSRCEHTENVGDIQRLDYLQLIYLGVISNNKGKIMDNEKEFEVQALQDELQKALLEKAETELDVRRGELTVKKINAMANLEKAKCEYMKLQLEQRRIEMDERRLTLEEIQAKYNIASDLAGKSQKLQHIVGKTMMGIFPAQDKQVAQIMAAAQKVTELKKDE